MAYKLSSSKKKMRRCDRNVHIDGNESLVTFSQDTTVLFISDTSKHPIIKDLAYLAMLNLHRTHVVSIENCPSLYSVSIHENVGMVSLESMSVREIIISNAYNLSTLELHNATRVTLDNLHVIEKVVSPLASVVSISNMSIDPRSFDILESFPNMKSLQLDNVSGAQFYDFDDFALTHLHIENCDITTLEDLEGYEEIVIKNCPGIRKISKVFDTQSLSVVDCDNLFKIENVFSITDIVIDRCSSLKTLRYVESTSLCISYCFDLTYLATTYIERVEIRRCPSITNIMLFDATKYINIEYCDCLESIDFESGDAFNFATLEMRVLGDNNIIDIKDWYVSDLTIEDNSNIETISSVYNVNKLTINNCPDLYEISNMVVLEHLNISNCPTLESVRQLYGIQYMSILECEQLGDMDIHFAAIKSVVIGSCPNIILSMDAERLQSLMLFDCGFVSIRNLNKTAVVNVTNTRMLPNVSSNDILDTELMHFSTLKLIHHISILDRLAQLLGRQARTYLLRQKLSKYIDIKKRDRVLDCVICYDSLSFHSTAFTPCNHMFHTTCLNRWFRERVTCPLCNQDL